MVVFVVFEKERVERTAHAIQAIHIASPLVGIGVQLAWIKEPLSKQRFQP